MERLSISRFWRKKDDHYKLVGKKCNSCGRVFYPPRHTCPYCGSRDLRDYVPPRTGIILSWTKLYNVGKGYEEQRPLYLALVKLGDLKLLTQVTDVIDESKLNVGAKVETVLRKVTEDGYYGLIYYGIKVRLVD